MTRAWGEAGGEVPAVGCGAGGVSVGEVGLG